MSGAHHRLHLSSQMQPLPGRRVPWEGNEREKKKEGGEGRREGREGGKETLGQRSGLQHSLH